ncbi:hypothetical protein BDV59DRAFT_203347 [Aspergillus ambiguus]|uniref:uncharacterized protein n=1 Tax=Aspergillus ambiguus TaxID=176160 RepID=UPI003CCCB4CF
MPPLPGEERILTVFADIHYYFSAPTPKPLQHRFDKGSYLYLYHNATQKKTRVEVANNPGTPDQDAFNGALDQVHFAHSAKFPTLCTLTVDGPSTQTFPPPPSSNPYEWHLPGTTGDHMRLHTLDIYFWTLDDANHFLDLLERHLMASQIASDRHPFPPPAQHNASTVVQQLENIAIADPAYQNGQTRSSQPEAAPTPQHAHTSSPSIASPSAIPPPPPPGTGSPGHQQQQPQNEAPAPLPYNPAAPAAPEPIKHREKTPPPPMDGAEGTGLAAAATADIVNPPGPPMGAPFSPQRASFNNNYTTGTTTTQSIPYAMPGSYASPPPSAGLPPPPASAGLTSAFHIPTSSLQSPPPTTTAAGIPSYNTSFLAGSGPSTTMSFAPPPKDLNAHLIQSQPSPSPYALPPQLQQHQHQPTPPPGGYANYSYDTAQPRPQAGIGDYEVHNQLYRPTEAEAKSHHQKYAQMAVQNPGQKPRGLEERAHRVESHVNKFLKRLEKKV